MSKALTTSTTSKPGRKLAFELMNMMQAYGARELTESRERARMRREATLPTRASIVGAPPENE